MNVVETDGVETGLDNRESEVVGNDSTDDVGTVAVTVTGKDAEDRGIVRVSIVGELPLLAVAVTGTFVYIKAEM